MAPALILTPSQNQSHLTWQLQVLSPTPAGGGGFSDIFLGIQDGRKVALKRFRVFIRDHDEVARDKVGHITSLVSRY